MSRLATLRPVASASKAARQSAGTEGKAERAATATVPVQVGPRAAAQMREAGGANQALQQQQQDAQARGNRLFRTCAAQEVREADRAHYMSSSGSEHEPSSVCLAAMVHEFMLEDSNGGKIATKCGRPRCNCENGVCDGLASPGDNEDAKSVQGKELADMVQSLVPSVNALEKSLLLDAGQAVAKVKEEASRVCQDGGENCTGCLRRLVMGELRRRGYNAAICKSRWDHAGGYPGGDYEYIDVLVDETSAGGKEERLLVDIDFRAQFEIARPTSSYVAILGLLPVIFVGKAERINQLVKIMSDASRRSLKKRNLHLPPWRKPEYLRAKWLSAYRRTTNPVPPQHCLVDSNLSRDIGSLAVRGHGFDERFRNAMELHYQREEEQALKEIPRNVATPVANVRRQVPDKKQAPVEKDGEKNRWKVMAAKEAEMEGRVRGANRMLFTKSETDPLTGLGTEVQMRDNSEWQPPAVEPRSPNRDKSKVVAGLASMLKQAKLQQQKVDAPREVEPAKVFAVA